MITTTESSAITRRVMTGVVALVLALAPAGVAAASHSDEGGPTRDFAVGGGFTGSESNDLTGAQHVGFAAFGGPTAFRPPFGPLAGDPVTGHFRAGGEFLDPQGGDNELVEFQQEGPVTCLVVDGNRARLVYPIKQARPDANEVNEVLIFLEDNGNPQNGEPVDRIGFAVLPDETPFDDPASEQDDECVVPPVSVAPAKLTKGNFVVHDAR